MLPSLGARLAAAPLAARATAYTGAWTAYAIGLQLALDAFCRFFHSRGLLVRLRGAGRRRERRGSRGSAPVSAAASPVLGLPPAPRAPRASSRRARRSDARAPRCPSSPSPTPAPRCSLPAPAPSLLPPPSTKVRTAKEPKIGAARMLAVDTVGYLSWMCLIGLLQVGLGVGWRAGGAQGCGGQARARSARALGRAPRGARRRPNNCTPPPHPAQAWLNPSWGDWSYDANLIALFWYQVPYML
jgi:hypothetical protein